MSRLYLIDDHTIVRECLGALLEVGGHTVVGETANPTEALADVQRLTPDVVLLDLQLGEQSGLTLLAELQRVQPDIRCLVLTSSMQPDDVANALRQGARGYVLKGSAGSDLMRAIEAVVEGKKYLGPEVANLALGVFTETAKDDPLSALSPRERQVIMMVINGQSSSEIGLKLNLSPKSVATYRSRLMAKLGVSDVSALVRLAIRFKLIDADNT